MCSLRGVDVARFPFERAIVNRTGYGYLCGRLNSRQVCTRILRFVASLIPGWLVLITERSVFMTCSSSVHGEYYAASVDVNAGGTGVRTYMCTRHRTPRLRALRLELDAKRAVTVAAVAGCVGTQIRVYGLRTPGCV